MTPPQLIEEREGGACKYIESPNWQFRERAYQCRVFLCPEEDGGFSAIACRLPGVVSQGETEEEALANIREAFGVAVLLYLEDPGKIPWLEEPIARPAKSLERWIVVNV